MIFISFTGSVNTPLSVYLCNAVINCGHALLATFLAFTSSPSNFNKLIPGWDKTFCLQYLKDTYDEVHFFGDKTFKGGNDFEIFSHPEVKGHTVTSPEDTIKQLGEIFGVKA